MLAECLRRYRHVDEGDVDAVVASHLEAELWLRVINALKKR